MKKKRKSIIVNSIVVFLVILATFLMFGGVTFMPSKSLLDSKGFEMFKFYTVDSNIFVGLATLLFLIYEIRYYKSKKKIPESVYLIKFISVSAVSLTFATTLFFLAPQYGFYAVYNNSNLFFHLIIPILSIASYLLFDNTKKNYFNAMIGIIPMFLYSIYYIGNIILHVHDGGLSFEYDFYGFLGGKLSNIFIVVPIIYLVSYLIAVVLIFINKRITKK